MDRTTLENDLYTAVVDGNYILNTLHRGDQTIYLLGEAHIKTKRCKELGAAAVLHFRGQDDAAIGTEGVETENYPLPIRIIMVVMLTIIYKPLELFFNDSTIRCAKSAEDTNTYHLEEGHKPHWREYAFFIIFPLLISWNVISHFWLNSEQIGVVIINSLISVWFSYEIIAMILGFPSLLFGGLSVARDKTMVSNIINQATRYKTQLVVCGKAHVSGVTKLLREEGFSPLSDSQKRCSCPCECGARNVA